MLNPINSFTGAIAAYTKAHDQASAVAGEAAAAPEGDFAMMVAGALDSAIAAGKSGERLSLAAVAGQADLTQVVTAVAEAETMLNTVVAVRDRVVEAYKDIMRMPI